MGMLWWLLTDGIQWVLGGLALLGGLFVWNSRKREGRAEVMREQEIADATAIKDRSRGDDAVRRAGAGAARKQLRTEWKGRELRRVDNDRG